MSDKEINRARIIQNYLDGITSRKDTAQILKLSERQVTRISGAVKNKGVIALIHKNTGRKPTHALTSKVKDEIMQIYHSDVYRSCNIRHFCEILENVYKIKISYTALYNIFKTAGIKSPRKHRKKKVHRRRKRKDSPGELLQIDASPFDWLSNGQKLHLHALIDDATGKITGMYLAKSECLLGYFQVMRQTFLNYGYPTAVYSDRHTIFCSPKANEAQDKGLEANLTQFGRALDELGVGIVHAKSPQAKGRIERLWGTLQSRLPVEFRLGNITTIEQANEFLSSQYREAFNKRFAVTAATGSSFVPFDDVVNLDNYLCIKELRKSDNSGVFSFHGRSFMISANSQGFIPIRKSVMVFALPDGRILVEYQGDIFQTVSFTPENKHLKATSLPRKQCVKPTGARLKHGSDLWRKAWHWQKYNDSLEFLTDLFLNPTSDKI